jgi:hypothetical protein
MTAIATRPASYRRNRGRRRRGSESLLRLSMRVDATLCAASGLFIAALADSLSRLSGLPAAAEWIAGAALVGYGALLYALAAVPAIRPVGIGVVAANVVFSIVAVAVLVAGVLPLTGAGVAATSALVASAVGCAYLQYLGVRRLA